MTNTNFSLTELRRLVIDGHNLEPDLAQQLEQDLLLYPADIPIRLRLLGYYNSKHYYSESYRRYREQHIKWMIENMWDNPICADPVCAVMKAVEPKFYNDVCQLWFERMKEHPDSIQAIVNTAALLLHSDIPKAKELALKADERKSDDEQVRRILQRIGNVEAMQPRTPLD